MKKLHEITDKFKMTKVRVPMEAPFSEDFQKAMFAMGFRWISERSGTPREQMLTAFDRPLHALYVDGNCRMMQSINTADFSVLTEFREITPLELFEAAKEYKALEKAIRKAKKAAKQGWIEWNGGSCPVAADTLIDVKYRNGDVFEGAKALSTTDRNKNYFMTTPAFWLNDGYVNDIVAYRLSKQELVTAEKPDADGWIKCDSRPEVDSRVDILFRGGDISENTTVDGWRYGVDGAEDDCDIVAYRLVKPAPVKQETVTLEEMVANIVADAGGKEVLEDGWIVHDPETCTLPDNVAPDGLKDGEYEVKLRNGRVTNGVRTFGTDCDSRCQVVAYRRKPSAVQAADVFVEVPETDAPDTNPKKQYGLASIPLNMWSNLASAYGALGLYNGALKYGTANFANTKVEASIYIAAIKRHLAAWEAGEEFDPADGVPNLGGCLANIAIILEARAAGTLIDDRALMSGYLKERDALKAILPRLHEVHEGKTPKHYTREA